MRNPIVATIWTTMVIAASIGALTDRIWVPVATVLVGVIALGLFERRAWAWWGVRHIVRRPSLRGTWGGVIRSNWRRNAASPQAAPINAYLAIRQTYTDIHIRLFTHESQSVTLAATLVHEPDGAFTLMGIYRNEARLSVRGRSPMHHGSVVLRAEGSRLDHMAGHYWTDRQSDGELEFRLLTREYIGDYSTANRSYPAEIQASVGESSQGTGGSLERAPEVQERLGKYLSEKEIFELHDAAIRCELDREALIASLDPSLAAQLRAHSTPGSQLLADLHRLNRMLPLTDGSIPFKSWLATAERLASPRAESTIFHRFLQILEESSATERYRAAND